MNRRLGFASVAALVLASGCGGTTDVRGDGGTPSDAETTCGGATASILAGSCTYSASGLTTCAEDYYNHTLSGVELEVYQQGCSGSGFTFSATDLCPTASVACKCVDTTGSFKRIRYGYGAYTDACGTCTGDCYSTE